MDKAKSERFASESFTVTCRIQRILESTLVPEELKEGLTQDYARLKEKVELLTRFREDREPAQRLSEILGPFFNPSK